MITALRVRLDQWRVWRDGSVNRRIGAAAATIAAVAIVVKAASVAKELIVAQRFGTGDEFDAYLIALLVPTFAVNVLAASFNAALVPAFVAARERDGEAAAQRLLSNVTLVALALFSAVTLALLAAAPLLLPLLGSGFDAPKLALTRSLLLWLAAVLVLSGLATVWGSVLNAAERFAAAAIAPIATPLLIVVALVGIQGSRDIHVLAGATMAGGALEAAIAGGALRSAGFSLVPRWRGLDPATRQVMHQYVPMIGGALLMSGTELVDRSMASMLPPGSVSALAYGSRLVAALLGVGSLALSTAVFPHFSRMVAVSDWAGARHTLWTYARLVLLVTVPLTIALVASSRPIVALLFERGAFSPRDTDVVARVQAFTALEIPFYVVGLLGVRLLSALRGNQVLLWIAGGSLALNVVANLLLMRAYGVAGIALSTSLVYGYSTVAILFAARRRFRAAARAERRWR